MQRVILSVEPVRYPLTGIGRYALELSRQLQYVYKKENLLFFDGREISDTFIFDENRNASSSNSKIEGLKSLVKKSSMLSEAYFIIRQIRESVILRRFKSGIVHATNFVCPRFVGKKIVTFHDMSAYITPECQEKVRLNILKKECEYTVRHADALITVSEASKQSIVDYFNYSAARVFVTPLACNSEFYSRNEKLSQDQLRLLGLQFKRYTLFVGTIEPRKNIITLIRAYRRLPKSLREYIPLVVCGHRGWKSDPIFIEIHRAISEGWLHYLNYVGQDTLLSLYTGARLFCFPSLYEGFGLPILEAMASKVPVISADNSSLPEVVGDAGILLPALDLDGWTENIRRVLESTSLSDELTAKGYLRSLQFSWEKCAVETAKVYNIVEQF